KTEKQKQKNKNRKTTTMKSTTILTMMVLTVIAIMTAGASKAMNAITVSDQGRICGRISEFITGQLLALASVELFSSIDSTLVVGTLTNNKGEFSFSMLKPGDYFLVVSLEGFATKQVQPVTVRKGDVKAELGEIQLSRSSRKPAKNQSAKTITYTRSTRQGILYAR
ncbi:MAG TPA: carboxypeptidase-like regulatory domain-containing protein, partial [Draconibacterium sp.]|nr:carboxypeptidase-like regulatory domain-containing protein [Draconibacterium sp.]